MLQHSQFSTDALTAEDRFDAWRERLNSTHVLMQLESECAADFHAHQRLICLGAVSMWPIRCDPLVCLRTPKLIRRSDPEVYHLSLLRNGVARASWGRQGKDYRSGHFHLNDSSRPSKLEIRVASGWMSAIGIEIPKALLPLPQRTVDRAFDLTLSNRTGPGALLWHFMSRLAADTNPYRPSDAPRLATVLADLVSAMLANAVDAESEQPPETRTRVLVLRVKEFIRRNLHDPEMTPSQVAARNHISSSYLHRLFRDEGETVATYIRRQRLDGAHRDLVDPAFAGTPIHVVAARWGFPRASEFTRAFRSSYGVAPSEYRSGVGRDGPDAPRPTSRSW
ncbi:helix-turn-helix domain-containing protein [Kribbella sp. NBC_00709]|uniref:helix-turn-helix domain-containing protein n=1 Tax=Kribbella sp. NBC_00709 TaxID=2975972 RepID=UPI002E2DF939|nr:helix-turn-helix domain-containing protein [Kribbella sp. NBC_00709]